MYTIERKAEIINVLERDKKVDVNQLAAYFGASRETIRRDLRDLEQQGLLTRTHGGAVLNETARDNQEFPLLVRGMRNHTEKNKICKYASSLIEDGDTIFIDNSSTTLNLVQYIDKNIRVTVITNSIQVLLESAKIANNNLVVIVLGGIFRPSNFSTYGNLSAEAEKMFYPSKSFLSCSGISQGKKLTDTSVYEVETKRAMIQQSKELYILADHSKFESDGTVFLTDFEKVTAIITDNRPNMANADYLKRYGVKLIMVE